MFENIAESILNENLFSGGKISSLSGNVQRGRTGLPNGSSYVLVAISEVDLNKSIVIVSYQGQTYAPTEYCPKAYIYDSTHLRIERYSNIQIPFVSWIVIPFDNVKSIQKIQATHNAGNQVQSYVISAVDVSRTIVVGSNSTSGSDLYEAVLEYTLPNSTTVQSTKYNDTNTYNYPYIYVVEFK